eukprot:TRINITY_DN61453_c0_g1_i1.p1 TRINITY_DN61453_c0_g1~~TRINITY_DN61453_c0_g1_i1.p1  ORF type:complete len:293 (+),score=24.92 TRINITY_DN61453_c0_g1_i1:149-1027(+)
MTEDVLKRFTFCSTNHHTYGICCRRHHGLKQLLKLVVEWRQESCDKGFDHYSGWQCEDCGVLCQKEPTHSRCELCATHFGGSGESSIPLSNLKNGMQHLRASFQEALHADGQAEQNSIAAEAGEYFHASISSTEAVTPGAGEMLAAEGHVLGCQQSATPSGNARQGGGTSAVVGDRDSSCMETSRQSVRRLVDETLKSWNPVLCTRLRAHSCCRKHAALEYFLMFLIKLQPQPCEPEFHLYDAWQCQSCGILGERLPANGHCSFCSHLSAPSSTGLVTTTACSTSEPTLTYL